MLASIFVYAGFILGFVALVCLIRPIPPLRISTRPRARVLLIAGALLVLIGFRLPIHETRVSEPQSGLDRFAPVYQFSEFHSTKIKASPSQVYRSINEVTAEEIALFRTLTWIRRAGRSGREGILNPAPGAPILQVATRTGFVLLAQDPDHEVVIGVPVLAPPGFRLGRKLEPQDFLTLRQPNFALAVMNFKITDSGSGQSTLTTETRIYATDPAAARKFHGYWSVVYPGSSLIRYSWLRAIKRRAEGK